MRRGSISFGRRVSRPSLLGLLTGLVLVSAAVTVETGCGAFCSSDTCPDGGAWFLVSGPEGMELADEDFLIEIETPRGTTVAACHGGSYGPMGTCVDEVLFFPDATGLVAVGELAFDEDTDSPILAMQVFDNVPNEDGKATHTFGPEELTVRIVQEGQVTLERNFEPTYARSGSERCGFCDRVDAGERIEVDLSQAG